METTRPRSCGVHKFHEAERNGIGRSPESGSWTLTGGSRLSGFSVSTEDYSVQYHWRKTPRSPRRFFRDLTYSERSFIRMSLATQQYHNLGLLLRLHVMATAFFFSSSFPEISMSLGHGAYSNNRHDNCIYGPKVSEVALSAPRLTWMVVCGKGYTLLHFNMLLLLDNALPQMIFCFSCPSVCRQTS